MPRKTFRKKNRRHRFSRRRQHGGRLPPLRQGAIQWPPNEGCSGEPKMITFIKNDTFDRFGPPSGSYVSPTGETAVRIAQELGITNTQPSVYSYTNRGLPYAGVSNSGVVGNVLRKTLYNTTYSKNFQNGSIDYYSYEVLSDDVKGNACVAAPVFDTSGGAIQIKLNNSINELIENKSIRNVPVTAVPGYFRENGMLHRA